MATKLKKMRLTSVDLVRAGANQEADICLFKSADPPKPTESPTEAEKNIFKRFTAWLRNNPTEAQNEPHSPIEKADDTPDLEFIYKSALTESLNSIMADDTLSTVEKKKLTEDSLRQYAEKIRELERDEEDYDGGDDIDEEAIEAVDDFDKDDLREELIEEVVESRNRRRYHRPEDIDEIDEVEKFNPYHDRSGRFSSAGGGGGGGASSGGSAAAGQKPRSAAIAGLNQFRDGYNSPGPSRLTAAQKESGNKLIDKYEKAIRADPSKAADTLRQEWREAKSTGKKIRSKVHEAAVKDQLDKMTTLMRAGDDNTAKVRILEGIATVTGIKL